MKKLILEWLFGVDNVDRYMELLRENMNHCEDGIKHAQECIDLIEHHKETLKREEWELDAIHKLLHICEKHGINVDEEIKLIKLEENANENLD
jgi:hypothetical protein